MIRVVHMLAIAVILVGAPRITVGGAPTAVSAAAQTTAESPPSPPAAADTTSAAPAGGPSTAPSGEPSFFSWAYWQEGGGGASRSEIARNFLLALAAFIGLGFGIWRAVTAHLQTKAAQSQARVAEQGHTTDRFSRSVEHLGSEELPVRLGGIYALWRVAKDSPQRDVVSVIDILCAFVRHPPHKQASSNSRKDTISSDYIRRPDAETIFKLLGDRDAVYRRALPADYSLDFSGADLREFFLPNLNLRAALLPYADLRNAYLYNTDFTGAILIGANLVGAILDTADLNNADLQSAVLTGVNLQKTKNLTPAQLYGIRYDTKHPPKLPSGLVLPEPPPEPEAEDDSEAPEVPET